jgi:hypothetical protein
LTVARAVSAALREWWHGRPLVVPAGLPDQLAFWLADAIVVALCCGGRAPSPMTVDGEHPAGFKPGTALSLLLAWVTGRGMAAERPSAPAPRTPGWRPALIAPRRCSARARIYFLVGANSRRERCTVAVLDNRSDRAMAQLIGAAKPVLGLGVRRRRDRPRDQKRHVLRGAVAPPGGVLAWMRRECGHEICPFTRGFYGSLGPGRVQRLGPHRLARALSRYPADPCLSDAPHATTARFRTAGDSL